MKLIDDWKQAYRWFSVHILLVIAAIPGAWDLLPSDMKSMLPHWVIYTITGLAFAGILGRVVNQTPKEK